MNILVNGASVSRGPGSWPYLVAEHFNSNIVNLSQAGAGNTYIHEATVSELAQRSYDLVLVQWTTFQRFDYKVKDISKFNDTIYTSKYQSEHSDWAGKVIFPINDQDYVEKDWVFGCGHAVNSDSSPNLIKAFEDFYQFTSPAEQTYHTIMKMVSLQSFLKANNIPYIFCFGRPFKWLLRYEHLNKLLDHNNIYSEEYVIDIATNHNLWDANDPLHPSAEAYKMFADAIIPKIKSIL